MVIGHSVINQLNLKINKKMSKIKQYAGFLRRFAGFAVLAALVAASVFVPQTATAACAAPNPSYGSASLQLSVSTTGTYRLWTRMNVPDTTNNSLLLEVNGECFVVGDSGITPNTWTWVNHQNGTASSKITAKLTAGATTIKVFGREPNVKLDRILAVADQNCTPSALGENCMTASDTAKPSVTITNPADNATVSGTETIKATATDNTAVSKVEFYVQNQLMSTDTTAPFEYNWDASGLANGTYTLAAKAYDPTGNSATDTQAVTVKNGDSEAPSAPSNLKVTAATYRSVNLTWTGSTDNTAVTAYRVIRNNSVIATVTTGLTYTDSTAVAGSTYTYQVVAIDGSNNASAPSNATQVTTPSAPTTDTSVPTTPTDLSATAISTSQINIAWKPSTDNIGIKEYDIYRNSDEDKTFRKIASTTNTSYGDGHVYDNTTFAYYIIARDGAGNSSSESAKAAATTPKLNERGTATLRGTVQGRNGRPIAGAKVTVWVGDKRFRTSTNWRGRYIITNLPAGRYDVSVRADGYDRETNTVRLWSGKTKWADVSLRRR